MAGINYHQEKYMRYASVAVAASAAFLATAVTTHGQESSMEGHGMNSTATIQLPEACRGQEAPEAMRGMSSDMEGMAEHQRAFMEAMMVMDQPMMQGVMADDPDIAFACGMIPHHQAAINMAEAELKYGDDEQMQQMAQAIIDAQKQEIEELTSWIEEQAQ